jgi:hypothetical protein
LAKADMSAFPLEFVMANDGIPSATKVADERGFLVFSLRTVAT